MFKEAVTRRFTIKSLSEEFREIYKNAFVQESRFKDSDLQPSTLF